VGDFLDAKDALLAVLGDEIDPITHRRQPGAMLEIR
jgi:hypothetical protein